MLLLTISKECVYGGRSLAFELVLLRVTLEDRRLGRRTTATQQRLWKERWEAEDVSDKKGKSQEPFEETRL